jgi:hypothetical protein
LAIYAHEGQTRLLGFVAALLDGTRLRELEDLVAARGPVPEEILRRMQATINSGKSYEYLADALNHHGVIAGMRGREWTAKKVRQALTESPLRA